MKKLICCLFLLPIFSTQAINLDDLAVTVDPYFQLNLSGYFRNWDHVNGVNEGVDGHGGAYGARAGFSWKNFGLGIDYSTGSMTYENRASDSEDMNIDTRLVGIYGSYTFMNKFRFLAEIFLESSQIYIDDDELYKNGEGFKFLVGYYFDNKVLVSLGYQSEIDLYKFDGPTSSTIGRQDAKVGEVIFVEFSIPLELSFN